MDSGLFSKHKVQFKTIFLNRPNKHNTTQLVSVNVFNKIPEIFD